MLTARQKDKILDLQVEMMNRYFDEYTKFYNGEITDEEYQINRVKNVSLWYAKQMVKAGLADREFDTAWIRQFAEDTLALERRVAPVGEPLTAEKGGLLCEVAKEYGQKFFENFHTDHASKVDDKTLHSTEYDDPLEEDRKEVQRLLDRGEWV